jgi:MOSC domain-containing protein YiiM
VITRGVDLNQFIGQEFEVQGVRFFGMEECRPCYWMDAAFAPGAQEFLKGRGGLRAKILCDGNLRASAQTVAIDTRDTGSPLPSQGRGEGEGSAVRLGVQ